MIRWLRESGRTAAGTDLSKGNDFLRSRKRRQFIITNPPFSIGLQFLQRSLELAPEALLLLPLNFLGSKYRKGFLNTHEPAALFVITPRPSFGLNKHGRKGTDSNEYAWFYWGHRWQGVHHL